jgi:hypothetical protein
MHMPPGLMIALMQISCFPYAEQITSLNGSPAATSWIAAMLRTELIEPNTDRIISAAGRVLSGYNITPRGKALIQKWSDTPLPILEETWK